MERKAELKHGFLMHSLGPTLLPEKEKLRRADNAAAAAVLHLELCSHISLTS